MATSGVSSDEETSEAVSDSNDFVDIVSDDSNQDVEFYDAENTEEESWQMAENEIYEIARRIGHEWFAIGIHLGYDHSLLERLESMYATEHVRRNFKMIACWCKIVANLQLNVRQHLAFHLSEASRQDIADDIGDYYKDVHTPKIVYNHVKKLSLDRSPVPFGHATDAVLVQQFKFDINMTTGAQNLTQVLQGNDRESFDTTNIKSVTWKQEKSDKSGECSAFACDELKAAVPNTKDRIWENEISTLVNNLFLKKFFPSKITLQDVRSIKSPDLQVTERTLPWLMLNKLVMLNYHAREEDLCLFYERNDERPVSEPDDSDEDLFEDTGICSKINPMDLFYVTFLACDLMLKQEIIGKLFTCHLAIPILFRDSSHQLNFTKWGLRQILINKRKDDKSFQTDALHHETKRISFVRIGRQTISKSKLINEIMYDQNHPTFFNRDCPLGTTERRTTDGIVEASWFIPSGKPNDLFGELIMFLNLRGDCSNFDEELDILCKLSHVLLVHINVENLADQANRDILLRIHQHNVKIVYALESSDRPNTKLNKILKDYKHSMEKFKQHMKFFNLKSLQQSRSASDITKELRKIIVEIISEIEGSSLKNIMDLITIADENISTTLKEGNRMANTVMNSLESSENIQKHIVLPLQGPIWVELCSALKTLYRSKSGKERQQLQSEMRKLRSRQNTICKKQMHPFMAVFLKHLENSKANVVNMFCFLAWMQTYLDEKSRDVLPQLILNYQNSWMEMKSAKEKNYRQKFESLAHLVEKRENELVAASFGLEHLIREIGQIYEARTKSRFARTAYRKLQQYPAFVSQFLQNGYPFEIMDGDTAMVPIPWVKAVFQQLKNDIGDKKLLAISVLGIQSSGKSTLLNAMFGLRFPVSAGRCTRGVFLQLVKVEKGVLPFSHVLVIDTEGLRAPELADKKHAHDK